MKNKKGFLITTIFCFLLVSVSLTLFMSNHKKVKADTITDLTGTTWIFNDVILPTSGGTYYINFRSNNQNYIRFSKSYSSTNQWIRITYIINNSGGTQVYSYENGNASWINNSYKTIEITGGSDATNANFISWLQANATQPSQGTEITHRYWAPEGVITMQDNQRIGDDDIQYTILFDEFTDTYTDTTQTGLYFLGVQTNQEPQWSYIESINGDGINILYHGTTNNINNAMWLEFTVGDYMDTELFNLMSLYGTWFDDSSAYLVGMNQGYVEGKQIGRALGQADGVEYTNIITRIFNGLGDLLTIQVFPNITIALIIGLPLLLGVFIIIIKILRG